MRYMGRMQASIWRFIVGLGVIGAITLCPTAARADLEVTASVSIRATTEFHAPLAPYGTWIEVGSYGRCWRPASLAVGWRPYCEGTWVWTDCGWYWQSDEPWGWACYHYGNWYEAPDYGWVWVPGVEWAPAWVSWRVGSGYCGWSPAPPHGVVVAPAAFVFVETHRFHEPVRRSRVIVNNTTIINKTTVIGGLVRQDRNVSGRAQQVVVNTGPDVAEVGRATGKKPAPAPIREVARRAEPPEKVARQIKQEQEQKIHRTEVTPRAEQEQNRTPQATAEPKPTTATAPATPIPKNVPNSVPDAVKPAPTPAPAPAPNRPQRPPGPPERQSNRPVTPIERTPPPVNPQERGRKVEGAPVPAPAPAPPAQQHPQGPPQKEKAHPQPDKGKGLDKEEKE